MMSIAGFDIERVAVIDDDAASRQAFALSVKDADLTPVQVTGPIPSLEDFISGFPGQAALCDHHLRQRLYAQFNGAEAVACCYGRKIPAVLCTRWDRASIDEIRAYRRYIPSLLSPDKLDPETLTIGWRRCIDEFHGVFQPIRKPWRAMVRLEEVDEEHRCCYVIIPAWKLDAGIRLRREDVPEAAIQKKRAYAKVNIGAEDDRDIYLSDWEV